MESRVSAIALRALGISRVENGREVLNLAEFSLAKGELLAIVGPNGAGKSSLLRFLAGLAPMQSGRASAQVRGKPEAEQWLMGQPRASFARGEIARTLAYLPQRASEPTDFTVRETIEMGRAPHRPAWQPLSSEDRAIVAEVLIAWELSAFADRPMNTLSGGEEQRVSIARIFAQRTPIVLLDEPSAALDLRQTRSLFDRLKIQISTYPVACAVATHDLAIARRYATRVLLLDQGLQVADGPPEAVLSNDNMQRVFGVDD
jgi:ABC-type cobalamin/Fe3+-siderophores transport system ATPase subunit